MPQLDEPDDGGESIFGDPCGSHFELILPTSPGPDDDSDLKIFAPAQHAGTMISFTDLAKPDDDTLEDDANLFMHADNSEFSTLSQSNTLMERFLENHTDNLNTTNPFQSDISGDDVQRVMQYQNDTDPEAYFSPFMYTFDDDNEDVDSSIASEDGDLDDSPLGSQSKYKFQEPFSTSSSFSFIHPSHSATFVDDTDWGSSFSPLSMHEKRGCYNSSLGGYSLMNDKLNSHALPSMPVVRTKSSSGKLTSPLNKHNSKLSTKHRHLGRILMSSPSLKMRGNTPSKLSCKSDKSSPASTSHRRYNSNHHPRSSLGFRCPLGTLTNTSDDLSKTPNTKKPLKSGSKSQKNIGSTYFKDNHTLEHGTITGFSHMEEMQGKRLPCFSSREDTFMRITANTLSDLILGKIPDVQDYLIVDCRFAYEFEGGHIKNAINIPDMDSIEILLLEESQHLRNRTIILHCEFSSKRAPAFAKSLRELDRNLNMDHYPYVHFPDIYILQGGYAHFYKNYSQFCDGAGYVAMNDPEHSDKCRKHLENFRKLDRTFSRAQSFTFGLEKRASTPVHFELPQLFNHNHNQNQTQNQSPYQERGLVFNPSHSRNRRMVGHSKSLFFR